MSRVLTPDICVIGAGSGGLTVAAAAAAFGVEVVLIEKARMGGDCLNTGCVPSKAMIAAAKQAATIRKGEKFGIAAGEPEIDFKKVHDHVHGVISAIAPHDSVERFTGLGVTVIEAAARFVAADRVVAGDKEIRARRFVIATGSSAAVPPIPGLDAVPFLTNETIFELTERPDHLIVIGGGPIGIELAQAHARLGAKVTVLEAFSALAKDDPDLTKIVLDAVRADGVDIREGAKITEISGATGSIRITLQGETGPEVIEGSHLLVAAGRKPNVDGLGLDAAGIGHDRRGITVDKGLRTSNRKVYAIGDVAGGYQFTHVAGYHAGLVIRSILFRLPVKENRDIIPWATYTDPELAHVGLTEREARERHGDVKVLKWPFAENDRAVAERATTGLVKIITTKKGRIVGADIVGQNAGEMISLYALAVAKKLTVKDFTGFIAPYPTRSEITKRVAVSYFSDSLSNPWLKRLLGFLRAFG